MKKINKSWIFTVQLRGYGDTSEEAWDDAVEAFSDDPGLPHETEREEDMDEEVGDED